MERQSEPLESFFNVFAIVMINGKTFRPSIQCHRRKLSMARDVIVLLGK